jgi:hypothetical glycosyl hydrolase
MKSSDTGIHSASMGGIWQCAVVGFGGLTIRSDGLHINPDLPECWKQICFSVVWHENLLHITASSGKVELENAGSKSVCLYLFQNCVTISAGKTVIQERSPEQ